MNDKKLDADDAISTGLEKEKKSRRGTIYNKTRAAIKKQDESRNIFRISDKTYQERLRPITLRRDEMFNFTVQHAPEVLQEMIRIVTGIDSPVTSATAQQVRTLLPDGKETVMDCFVLNERGDQICIEMQNYDDTPERFLLYGQMMRISTLKKGDSYHTVTQHIVIVFLKDDIIQSEKFGDRIQFDSRRPYLKTESHLGDTNVTIESGSTVYFVNGSYKNNDEIGQLIQSLSEPDPAGIQNPVIKKWMMDVKDPGGKYHMSLLEVIYGPEISEYYVPRTEYLEKLAEKDLELKGKDKALTEKDLELKGKDKALTEKDLELKGKDKALTEKDLALEGKDRELAEKNQEIEKMKSMFAALLAEKNSELTDLDQYEILAEFMSSSKKL